MGITPSPCHPYWASLHYQGVTCTNPERTGVGIKVFPSGGMLLPLLLLFVIPGWGCGHKERSGDGEDPGRLWRERIVAREPEVLVPSPLLPREVTPQTSHNNLDVVIFRERLFLVFRSAPSHFASEHTTLYVMSRVGEDPWRWEGSISLGRDLREPRFLLEGEELSLYFAVLGTNPVAFEPGEMRVTRYLAPGVWSEAAPAFRPGFIPWRMKRIGGETVLFGYEGGENIYNFSGKPLRVYMLKRTPSGEWIPWDSTHPLLFEGGCSETDGIMDGAGDLYVVCRNEAGDAEGFGSRICKAPRGELSRLTCTHDSRKFDSPLLFTYGAEIFLIARRNLTVTGDYDIYRDYPYRLRLLLNQLQYWSEKKRCSLWVLDQRNLKFSFVLDLVSRGDTCFPSILWKDEHELEVYNYTSNPFGPDLPWREGQLSPTWIVRQTLSFPEPRGR